MATQFEMDVLAEFAAVNTAVITALRAIVMIHAQGDASAKARFLSDLLESGSTAMEKTNYWSVPNEQRAAFLENAKARYADLITSI
jgi:hypothetical protein